MAFVECGNGHIFDNAQYQACPYCAGGGYRMEFGTGAGMNQVGATVAPAQYQAQFTSEVGATVAPAQYRDRAADAETDTGKTVGVLQKKMNMEPVVGWLVCIEGVDKGKDFRILAKNNTIGRSEKMDICIKGDTAISRENHARIGYDEKHNAFHLIPGEGSSTVYLGEEPVYVPTKLEEGQVIEMGETKLLFVPLCKGDANWEAGFVKGE